MLLTASWVAVMMVVMVVMLMLMLSSSLGTNMRLFVLLKVRGEQFVEGHSAKKLSKNIHGVFEDKVEMSLT